MNEPYFPLGVAAGPAFLGRKEETRQLIYNISQGRHTLLLSPRRYGKTSLARHIMQSKYIFSEIDLFLAIDEYAIESRFTSGVESIIQSISGKKAKWFHLLLDFFKKAEQTWTIGFKGIQLELRPNNHQDIPSNLLQLFNALEFILSKQQKKVVLFVDEFQEISKINQGKAIEGAIRHFAQAAKHVIFIFSGSSRHLLLDIFGSRTRPLYKLCDWITLSRLDRRLYQDYLNKVAQQTFGMPLPEEVFNEIMTLSECHPEATYALCGQLWSNAANKKMLVRHDVQVAWEDYITKHLKQTRQILSGYSSGQLKVLVLIAMGVTKGITGKDSQAKLGLTSPSISKALHVLEAEDLLEKNENGFYSIIDPIIKTTLLKFYSDYLRE